MVNAIPSIDSTGLEMRVVCVISLLLISMDVSVGNVMGNVSAVCVAVII